MNSIPINDLRQLNVGPVGRHVIFKILFQKNSEGRLKYQYAIADQTGAIQLYYSEKLAVNKTYILCNFLLKQSTRTNLKYLITEKKPRLTPLTLVIPDDVKQFAREGMFPLAPTRTIVQAEQLTQLSTITGTIIEEQQVQEVELMSKQSIPIKKIKIQDSTTSADVVLWKPSQEWLNICQIAQAPSITIVGHVMAYDIDDDIICVYTGTDMKEFKIKKEQTKNINTYIVKNIRVTAVIKENEIVSIKEA